MPPSSPRETTGKNPSLLSRPSSRFQGKTTADRILFPRPRRFHNTTTQALLPFEPGLAGQPRALSPGFFRSERLDSEHGSISRNKPTSSGIGLVISINELHMAQRHTPGHCRDPMGLLSPRRDDTLQQFLSEKWPELPAVIKSVTSASRSREHILACVALTEAVKWGYLSIS
jgi:hypothetical protein